MNFRFHNENACLVMKLLILIASWSRLYLIPDQYQFKNCIIVLRLIYSQFLCPKILKKHLPRFWLSYATAESVATYIQKFCSDINFFHNAERWKHCLLYNCPTRLNSPSEIKSLSQWVICVILNDKNVWLYILRLFSLDFPILTFYENCTVAIVLYCTRGT